jgi:hypothetical protein
LTKEEWGNGTLDNITQLAGLWFVLLTKFYLGDGVEGHNVAGSWGEERCLQKFDVEVWRLKKICVHVGCSLD